MGNIIEVKNVSMRFNLEKDKTDTIKEYLMKMVRRQLRFSDFYALRDVSFDIEQGDSVALIGTNAIGVTDVNWIAVGSASVLAGIVSLLTSVAGLPEVDDTKIYDLTTK